MNTFVIDQKNISPEKKEIIIEQCMESIELCIDFISTAQKTHWRYIYYNSERNKKEEEWRIESIQRSKESIKFNHDLIKHITSD